MDTSTSIGAKKSGTVLPKKSRNLAKMKIGDSTAIIREPTPVKQERSILSELFNLEVRTDIPGVLCNVIEELIKSVEENKFASNLTNNRLENQSRY